MRIIFVYQKPSLESLHLEEPWRQYGYLGEPYPSPPGARVVWYMDRPSPPAASSEGEPIIVFVHANDTLMWKGRNGEGTLEVSYVLGMAGHLRGGILCVLPFTTRSENAATDTGEIVFGKDSLSVVLAAVLTKAETFNNARDVTACLLSRRDEKVGVHALSILCQGYLAIEGAWSVEVGDAIVLAALERMGWTALTNGDTDLLRVDALARKRNEVHLPQWWRAVFPARPGGDILGTAAANADVQALLDAIYDEREIPPDTVARAYLELAKEL